MVYFCIDCDCYGPRTDSDNCTSYFNDGKNCTDFTDSSNTTLVQEECMINCSYCSIDPCDPEGDTCNTSIGTCKCFSKCH